MMQVFFALFCKKNFQDVNMFMGFSKRVAQGARLFFLPPRTQPLDYQRVSTEKMQKIPFSPPHIDEETIRLVAETLRSGWITTGPKTKKFENQLTFFNHAERTLCVNSATAGMELMLRWLGIGPGDEVIIPAYTYCATANVVVHCGAKPVMVDVKAEDACIDPEAVSAAITPKTKAIMPVDLGGLPVHYTALRQIIEEAKPRFRPDNERQEALGRIALITDAAHSLGAQYKGRAAACQSDAAVFSFHAVKNLTTAEGGAISLNWPKPLDNDQIYQTLNTLSLHGQSKDALAKFGKNAWEYDVVDAGYKCNMPDVLAAIGLSQFAKYSSHILPRRRQIFEHYDELLKNSPQWLPPLYRDEERESSYHLYLLRMSTGGETERNTLVRKIFEAGVSVNVHYKPLPLLTAYRRRGYRMEDYPNAFRFYEREITLPVYYDLSDEQIEIVAHVLNQCS